MNYQFPIAIICGGLGTRISQVIGQIPKSMVEINGKPFIYYQIQLLKQNGFNKIVICTGYLGDQIKQYVKDGSQFGVSVDYSFDGDMLLKTGGSVYKALPLLGDIFWVMYGDSYLPIEFNPISEYFCSTGKKGLMVVLKNSNQWDKSNVVFNNNMVVKYDKKNVIPEMEYIDYGVSILKKESFINRKENIPFDLLEIFQSLISKNEMAGYEVYTRFYEIGSVQGLAETREYLTKKYQK